MRNKFCQRCGSSDLIADRALAGRIVCSVCGSKDIGNRKPSFMKNKPTLNFNNTIFISIGVLEKPIRMLYTTGTVYLAMVQIMLF